MCMPCLEKVMSESLAVKLQMIVWVLGIKLGPLEEQPVLAPPPAHPFLYIFESGSQCPRLALNSLK